MIPFEPPKKKPTKQPDLTDRVSRWSLGGVVLGGLLLGVGDWQRLFVPAALGALILPIAWIAMMGALLVGGARWQSKTLQDSVNYRGLWRSDNQPDSAQPKEPKK